MATLGEQAGALFQILQQKAPPDNFASHVKALSVASTQIVTDNELFNELHRWVKFPRGPWATKRKWRGRFRFRGDDEILF